MDKVQKHINQLLKMAETHHMHIVEFIKFQFITKKLSECDETQITLWRKTDKKMGINTSC
jgi:hypothetical protein